MGRIVTAEMDLPLPEAPGHARQVGGVVIAGFCVFLQLYAPQPMLVLFQQYFGASEAQVSLIISAAALAVAAAAPFVGMLADTLGRKRVIVPCLFILALSTLGCALAGSLPALLAWRFVGGICTPGVIAVTLAYISEELPHRRSGSVTALYVTGTVMGGLTGRISAAFVAQHFSWRWSFVLLAVLTLAGAIGAWAFLPRSRQFVRQSNWHEGMAAMAGHLRNPRLLATYLCGFNVLFCHVGLFTYLNFYLAAPPFLFSTSALGLVFVVYALGIVVTPWAGRMIDRTGHRAQALLAVGLVVAGAVLTLILHPVAIIAGIAVASSGVFVMQAAASSHIGRAAKGARSAASGLYVACYYLGGSCGATALVIPWHRAGWPAVVGAVVAVQVVSLVAAWLFFARGPQPQAHLDTVTLD